MTRGLLIAAVLAVACMGIAVIGRAGDWSPYALTMLGALAGVVAGVAFTVLLAEYATEDWDQ